MKILHTKLRAIVEKVSTIEVEIEGQITQLYVFEQLGENGKPYGYRIQNWECDDITHTLDWEDRERIMKALEHPYFT
jgi:hypothetical protein